MKQGEELAVFVYGTLMPGGRAWAERCEGRVVEMRRARVRGRLFDLKLAGYPAVADEMERRSTAAAPEFGWVHGWRLMLKDATALRGLDEWEGCQPGRTYPENDYNRTRVLCFDEGAEGSNAEMIGEAWVYVMRRERVAELGGVEVPGGKWAEK